MRLLGRPSNSTHILGGRSATGLGLNGRNQRTVSLHLVYAPPGKHLSDNAPQPLAFIPMPSP